MFLKKVFEDENLLRHLTQLTALKTKDNQNSQEHWKSDVKNVNVYKCWRNFEAANKSKENKQKGLPVTMIKINYSKRFRYCS